MPPPGRDFIIQANQYLSPLEPADPSSGFLDPSGHLQSICQNASTFVLRSGLLYSGGDQVSVAPGVSSMRFGASEFAQPIDKTFAVDEASGRLVWNNDAFSDGTARFCNDPAGALYAVFSGPLPENCTATELRVQSRKWQGEGRSQSRFVRYLLTAHLSTYSYLLRTLVYAESSPTYITG